MEAHKLCIQYSLVLRLLHTAEERGGLLARSNAGADGWLGNEVLQELVGVEDGGSAVHIVTELSLIFFTGMLVVRKGSFGKGDLGWSVGDDGTRSCIRHGEWLE